LAAGFGRALELELGVGSELEPRPTAEEEGKGDDDIVGAALRCVVSTGAVGGALMVLVSKSARFGAAVVVSPGPRRRELNSDFPCVPKTETAPNLGLGCAYECAWDDKKPVLSSGSPSVSGWLTLGQRDAVFHRDRQGHSTPREDRTGWRGENSSKSRPPQRE
jgi:hypothetical protein